MKDEHLYDDDSKRAREIAALKQHLNDKSLNVDDYLSEEEWKQYLNSADAGRNSELPDDNYRPVYKASVLKTKRTQFLYKGLGIILLLLVCSSAFYFLYNRNSSSSAKTLAYDHQNITKGPERIQLPDGTVVILYAESEIHYAGDYNVSKRDLYLKGDAEFRVFKDDNRPLTVYCRNLATTAIGTRFRVNGLGADAFVHLFEGKIRMRDTADAVLPVYPLPGETLAYRTDEKRFVAVDIHGAPLMVASPAAPKKIPIPQSVTDPATHKVYLNFENRSLTDIFDFLAVQYQVEIRYPTDIAQASNMFISVDKAQPVPTILQNICRANGLKVKAYGDTLFTISK